MDISPEKVDISLEKVDKSLEKVDKSHRKIIESAEKVCFTVVKCIFHYSGMYISLQWNVYFTIVEYRIYRRRKTSGAVTVYFYAPFDNILSRKGTTIELKFRRYE